MCSMMLRQPMPVGAVRDDAHLGSAEVVVEKILEPHARDEEEVPRIPTTIVGVARMITGVSQLLSYLRRID